MELVNVSRPLSSLRKVLDKKPCLFPKPVWKAWNTEGTEWEASGTDTRVLWLGSLWGLSQRPLEASASVLRSQLRMFW